MKTVSLCSTSNFTIVIYKALFSDYTIIKIILQNLVAQRLSKFALRILLGMVCQNLTSENVTNIIKLFT